MIAKNLILLPITCLLLLGWVSAQDYDKIHELKGGFKRVEKDGKTGFLNADDELVIPLMYDAAYDFNLFRVAAVKKDGLIGFINKDNKYIIEPKFSSISKIENRQLFKVELNEKKGLYSYKGEEIVKPAYDQIYTQEDTDFLIVENGGKQGFIDNTGKEITAIKYKEIFSSTLGISVCQLTDGTYSFLDEKGEQFKETFEDVYPFEREGLALVFKNGKAGFINTKGKIAIPFNYSNAKNFDNGYAFVIMNDELGRIDTKGNFQKFGKGMGNPYDSIYVKQKGENIIPAKVMGKFACVDLQGQIVIPPVYDWFAYFENGIACAGKGGKYGAINKQNEVLIPFKYKFLERYRNADIILMNLESGADIYTIDGTLLASCESVSELGADTKSMYTVVIKGVKQYINLEGEFFRDKTEEELTSELQKQKANDDWEEEQKLKNTQTIDKSTPLGAKGKPVALKIKYASAHSFYSDYINNFSCENDKIITYGAKNIKDSKNNSVWMRSIGTSDYKSLGTFKDNNEAFHSAGKYIDGVKLNSNEMIADYGFGLTKFRLNQQGDYDSITSALSQQALTNVVKYDENYVVALGTSKLGVKSLQDLYLFIWDHKNNKSTSLLLAKGSYWSGVQLLKTSTGEILVAYDVYDAKMEDWYETYLEKINILETIKSGKVKTIWKNYFTLADRFKLTDLIEDKSGNFIGAFQSAPYDLSETRDKKLIELGIAKIDKDGKTFQSKVFKTLEPEQWGRSSATCKLRMRDQDQIKFSSAQQPKIIQSPFDNGYIMMCRFGYGIWEYECDGESFYKGLQDNYHPGYTGMYADQPAFLYIDEKSLDVHSADFIESTGENMAHSTGNYDYKKNLGNTFELVSFAYLKGTDRFVLLEKDSYSSYLYVFSLSLYDNWEGGQSETAYTSNTNNSNNSSNSSSGNSSSSNTSSSSSSNTKTEEFTGQVHFHFNHANKTKGERLYIHYGSNGSSKTSTGVGSDASIRCEAGKVYYSFTGEKKDMILITDLKPSDCKKKFYSEDFVK